MVPSQSPHAVDLRDAPQAQLAHGQAAFIELWGHMAGNWGVARSMAEVHALLFIAGVPLNAEAIMARLRISRGNTSMTLRTLEEWGIVTRQHCREDRKDYFTAEQDVRTLLSTVICARKRREIDPLLEKLTDCRGLTDNANDAASGDAPAASALRAHNRKLDDMLEFVRALDVLTTRFLRGGGNGLDAAIVALKGLS